MMEMFKLVLLLLLCTPLDGKESFESGPCARKVAQYLNAQDSHIPSCKEDGTYKPTQCVPVSVYITNYLRECWCVTEDGIEIPGTRKKMVKGNLDCEDQNFARIPNVKSAVTRSKDNLDGRMVEPLSPNGMIRGSSINQNGPSRNQGGEDESKSGYGGNPDGSTGIQETFVDSRNGLGGNQGGSPRTQGEHSANQDKSGGRQGGCRAKKRGFDGSQDRQGSNKVFECKPDHVFCTEFKKEADHFCARDWLKKNCKNMCGLGCGKDYQANPTQVFECKADHVFCMEFKKEAYHFCKQDWLKKNCQNMCGLGCGADYQSNPIQNAANSGSL